MPVIDFAKACARRLRTLARSERGVALIEFAYATPVVMALSLYGLELANLTITNQRVSQIAANLADTASRIGENTTLSQKRIRESDINDAFAAISLQGGRIPLTTRGRIILSSLERNATNGQWIHWQRCKGLRNHVSSYGVAGAGATGNGGSGDAFRGMGDPGQPLIQAPANSAVMFVEIVYAYEPLINSRLVGEHIIRAKAAFLVRERRDLDDADNPANPAPAAPINSCAVFSA